MPLCHSVYIWTTFYVTSLLTVSLRKYLRPLFSFNFLSQSRPAIVGDVQGKRLHNPSKVGLLRATNCREGLHVKGIVPLIFGDFFFFEFICLSPEGSHRL